MNRNCAILTLGVGFIAFSVCSAGQWGQWRGPFFNGSSDETHLPSQWSRTDNIAWSADLMGTSGSTPVVCGDRVFLSGVNDDTDSLVAICFDRKTGKTLWEYEIAKGTHRDNRSTYAAPSPVTDGKNVWFFYSTGLLICYDIDGKKVWSRNIKEDYGVFAFLWTFSSSPVLHKGKLYLQVLQRDTAVSGRGFSDRMNESYLLAMDPATGKTLWRHIRDSKAVVESREAFNTPIPVTLNGKEQMLVLGGDALTGHDLETGEELWRWETWNPGKEPYWRLVPSAVEGKGIVLVCGPKNSPVYAIRPKGTGQLGEDVVAWISKDIREVTSDVPTPAFYDGDFFVLSDLRRSLSRIEPETGKVKWMIDTPGRSKYEASPLAADGKIYIINHAGEVSIIDAQTGKVLREIDMDDPKGGKLVRSSIVAAYGQLYIRTTMKLYCIGK